MLVNWSIHPQGFFLYRSTPIKKYFTKKRVFHETHKARHIHLLFQCGEKGVFDVLFVSVKKLGHTIASNVDQFTEKLSCVKMLLLTVFRVEEVDQLLNQLLLAQPLNEK